MKLTVIVINYHCADILNRCLNSIHTANSCEIFVVDNDNQLPVIERKGISVIGYAGNLGFSGANNKAMALAQGEYVLFLNADVFLQKDYIDRCIGFLDEHPDCASVQGKLLKESNPGYIDSTGNVVTRWFWAFNEHHLDRDDASIPSHEIYGVCCAAGVFRRSMLDAVSIRGEVFDNDFFAYLEDVDLNIRLRQQGYSSWFVADATALHIREASSKFWFRFQQSMLNRYLLVVKHKGLASVIINSLVFLPPILAFIPGRSATLKKLQRCHKKRSKSPDNLGKIHDFDDNSRFFRHVYKRLRNAP